MTPPSRPKLASSDVCTGCAACANICPYDCISMQVTSEGFLEPNVNPALCPLVTKGKCGICEDICPVLHPKYLNNNQPDCYALQASDEERKQSSSGAFIPILAKYILARPEGGFVYGAAWTENLSLEHVEVSNEDELFRIRLSKYVQSNPKLIYRQVKKRLKEGKWVLFTGTPCEVAGLYSTLGKVSTEKLVTVDLVCHGVPSIKVFKKFLTDSGYKLEDIKDFKFRDKEQGWHSALAVYFKDGGVNQLGMNTSYTKGFNLCLTRRKSCGVCTYAKLPRQGDLSCGDFWGVENFYKLDNKGTSFVLINSSQGKNIFAKLLQSFPFNKKLSFEIPISLNQPINNPCRSHTGRKHFFSSLDLKPFNKLVNDSLSHHYDIGIVGPWFGKNYGGILTYFALYHLLRSLGFDAVFLPRPSKLWKEASKSLDDPKGIAQKFMWKNCNVFKASDSLENFYKFNNSCDAFVLGSDVVWMHAIFGRHVGYFYFLDWVSSAKKKIAYASSMGADRLGVGVSESDLTNYTNYVSSLFKRFSAIGVRESSSVEVISDLTGRTDVVQVLDPVFMVDKQTYLDLQPEDSNESKHIFVYVLNANNSYMKKALFSLVPQTLKIKDIYFCPNPKGSTGAVELPSPEYNWKVLSVEDWINKLSTAEFFIGDSYHGLCFSLIFHVPFLIVFEQKNSSIERFLSLLKLVGLEERLVCDTTSVEDVEGLIYKPIDWNAVDQRIAEKREFSLSWLKEQLENKTNNPDPEIVRLENINNSLRAQIKHLQVQIAKLGVKSPEPQQGKVYELLRKHKDSIPYWARRRLMWLKPYIKKL